MRCASVITLASFCLTLFFGNNSARIYADSCPRGLDAIETSSQETISTDCATTNQMMGSSGRAGSQLTVLKSPKSVEEICLTNLYRSTCGPNVLSEAECCSPYMRDPDFDGIPERQNRFDMLEACRPRPLLRRIEVSKGEKQSHSFPSSSDVHFSIRITVMIC